MSSPCEIHFKLAKRVLRYIKGTIDYSLKFTKCIDANFRLHGYCDADWGSNLDRRSISGFGFQFNINGTASLRGIILYKKCNSMYRKRTMINRS